MKINIAQRPLLLIALSFYVGAFSQTRNNDISEYFKAQQIKNDSIFDAKIGNLYAKGSTNVRFDKSKLAAINDDYILFWQEDDIRANKASNIDFLQNGAINNIALVGQNMEVAVFDGGRALATHEDFTTNGASRIVDLESNLATPLTISSHATAVSGLIAANGLKNITLNSVVIPNASRGVVPNAIVKTASFQDTTNGNNYEKIVNYQIPISNHSYGVNYGWFFSTPNNLTKTVTFTYPVNPNVFLNDEETFAGAYLANDYNFDLIANTYPHLTIVKSAGNYDGIGPDNFDASWTVTLQKYNGSAYVLFEPGDIVPKSNSFNGAYSISTGSLAKNILVVGSINLPPAGADSNFRINSTADVVKSYFSSVGPRKDGGIKPDLVTVGSDVVFPGIANNSSYLLGSGTSYAAPIATGVVVALTELKRKLLDNTAFNFDSDQVKALLLHTTKESGAYPGPDNKFGWGVLDAKHAAEVLLSTHNEDDFFEKNIKEVGIDYSKTVTARVGEELKVTLTWIDPQVKETNLPATNREVIESKASRIVNDLDLRIVDTQTNQVYYPWKLDINNVTGPALQGDNSVDNVEQISIALPSPDRNYKVIVSNKGRLFDYNEADTGVQTFSLLITGADKEIKLPDEVPPVKVKTDKITVYPTISDNIVNIVSDYEVTSVEMYDITAKLITTFKTKTLNISNLSNGLYILKIATNNGKTVIKKIIKE